jgi:hypothetical protein
MKLAEKQYLLKADKCDEMECKHCPLGTKNHEISFLHSGRFLGPGVELVCEARPNGCL